ncbi:MAG: ribonuclease H-like YkuK family protein [bacterium]|nr:ribonuclease H-like YkuK family protein [bacterium]
MIFQSPTKGSLIFDEVIDEVCAEFRAQPKARYRIMIGSDSKVHGDTVDCISAIVLHRIGRGARYFWVHTQKDRFHTLRDRIWHEAVCSTTLAQSTLAALGERGAWGTDLEVHVDVGRHGPTKDLIQEICGYVRAYGFTVCIKPQAHAATCVADRYT